MDEELNVVIREAIPDDAEEILAMSKIIGQETEFLVMDEKGMGLDVEDLAYQLAALYDSPNNILLVAVLDAAIIATASVRADSSRRIGHIGEVGISVLQEYWGIGLGTMMLEELIHWAEAGGVIRRLELTVQCRNERAVSLYKKFGFATEGTLARGARSDGGEFLDVYLMSRMID